MKHTTNCPIHGSNLRPNLCHDCARVKVAPVLLVTEQDRNRLEKTSHNGRIVFREAQPISKNPNSNDPWGQIWD